MRSPYDYEIQVNPGYGKKRFSRQELLDILMSVIVLAVAFVILRRGLATSQYFVDNFGDSGAWFVLFGICLILVVVSFLLHEFGHKFVAQRYGMWSEFRVYPIGLLLTLVTSFMGFLFAAPGAVYIQGYADTERNGKISMAGPIVNIFLAVISAVAIAFLVQGATLGDTAMVRMTGTEYMLFLVFSMLLSLNAFLAVFNLIPFPPLDGSKILPWNKVVWVLMFAVAIIELVFYFIYMPDMVYITY